MTWFAISVTAGQLPASLAINKEVTMHPLNCTCSSCNPVESKKLEKPRITVKKPEIGIMPRWLYNEQRFIEILTAMERFIKAKQQIPDDWYEELKAINKMI